MNNVKWSITNIILAIIVVAGMIGIMYVALHEFGIAIPPFIITVLWIVLVVIICCAAVKFISFMFNGGPPNPPGP